MPSKEVSKDWFKFSIFYCTFKIFHSTFFAFCSYWTPSDICIQSISVPSFSEICFSYDAIICPKLHRSLVFGHLWCCKTPRSEDVLDSYQTCCSNHRWAQGCTTYKLSCHDSCRRSLKNGLTNETIITLNNGNYL